MTMQKFAGYKAYEPRPFTKADRDKVTLLFGGLTWRAERALEGVFEGSGYKAKALPSPTKADLLKGRELADIGQCCPTAFTTGNLVNFLAEESKRIGADEVADKYAYITAGSCGSCRFGQYHQSYELALRNLDLENFRLFLMSQTKVDQSDTGGLELNPQLLLRALLGVLAADVIQDIEYQIRPYEVEPGATTRAAKLAVEELHAACRDTRVPKGLAPALLWALTTRKFNTALRRARKHFAAVELDRLRVKAVVKITGEFYLQTVEGDANYNIHSFLEKEGAEVYPAVVAIWFDYLLRFNGQKSEERIGIKPGAERTARILRFTSKALRWRYDQMRKALGGVPKELPLQSELRDLAAPYFDARLSGGEGDMLIGKAIWSHTKGKAHMICELSPYSCLPNTMSIGAMAAVQGAHPDMLYAPLEIKGDSEVHALSRCQMILTEAKARARDEFDRALTAAGLTEEEARERLKSRPDLNDPLRPVPRRGAVGTAANIVLELGGVRL